MSIDCTWNRDCSSCEDIGVDVKSCPEVVSNSCCSSCGHDWQCNPYDDDIDYTDHYDNPTDDDDDYYGHLPCGCCDCCGCSCDERDDEER